MFRSGKGSGHDLLFILLQGFDNERLQVGKFLYKLGNVAVEHTQHVVDDQNLSITMRAGSYANGRAGYFRGDAPGQFGGHTFHHQGKNPGLIQSFSILNQLCGFQVLALYLEAPNWFIDCGSAQYVPAPGSAHPDGFNGVDPSTLRFNRLAPPSV